MVKRAWKGKTYSYICYSIGSGYLSIEEPLVVIGSKMNMLASECRSECESGWTVYLEQSFLNAGVSNRSTGFLGGDGGRFYEKCKRGKAKDVDETEEDDLSMVSDASSGPPHYHDDDDVYLNTDHNGFFYPPVKSSRLARGCNKMQKVQQNQLHQRQELPSFLDDTASSTFFNFSTNNFGTSNVDRASTLSVMDFSQGFSATYIEGRAGYQENFDFIQPALSESELHQNQWFGGSGTEMIQDHLY